MTQNEILDEVRNATPFYTEFADDFVRYFFYRNRVQMVIAEYDRRTTCTRYSVEFLPRSMR